MDSSELKSRTKQFGIRVVNFDESLPIRSTTAVIGRQLLRLGTSVGVNYRSACRAQSKADFASKISIAIEEADESIYRMELLIESGIMPEDRLLPLIQEADELVVILTASVITVRKNIRNSRQASKNFQSN